MLIRNLDFKAGPGDSAAPVKIHPKRVTIFIGPNNGGKSQALRDLASKLNGSGDNWNGVVINDVGIELGDADLLDRQVLSLRRDKNPGENPSPDYEVLGRRGNWSQAHLPSLRNAAASPDWVTWRYYAQMVLQHSLLNLSGENRLGLANPVGAEPMNAPATSTPGIILRDNALRKKISSLVHEAFGRYLVIDPTAMSQISYSFSAERPANLNI